MSERGLRRASAPEHSPRGRSAAEHPLRRSLLRWYGKNRRRLPWRERPSPYRTWVSEIMLQQTRVDAVLPYYRRFLERFPTPASLARAGERAVLRSWAGLGYYSRARNLRRAAQSVMAEHGGRVPSDPERLLRLPGVGRYTAAAVLSIAFGRPYAVVDGNVARVLSRLYCLRGDPKRPAAWKELERRAAGLLHRGRPGDWNQALMELGALVCVPESPRCGECPWRRRCLARGRGLQEALPESGPRRRPVDVVWRVLRIRDNGRILLWKRPDSERLLPGHWGLPEAKDIRRVRASAKSEVLRHSITHHRIKLVVRDAELLGGALPPRARWVPAAKADDYLVSSVWRKTTRGLRRRS